MNRVASAREPVNYDEMGDAIVLLRKQDNSLRKILEEITANLS